MDSLIITAYEFSTSFIPFIIIMIFLNYQHKKQEICVSKMYCGIMTVFAIYIIAVFHFTSAGTLYDALLYKLERKQGQLNFIPFSNDIDITAYLQNILLFIPFGFLVPFICKQNVNIINILSTAFTFSLLIEVSQLLNNRRTDIDDLILNTFGAVIGFILYKFFIRITKFKLNHQSTQYNKLLIVIAVTFIGRFLLFNEIAFAKLFYKF